MPGINYYDEWQIDEQDLRMFKAILTDQKLALDFTNNIKSNLFMSDAEPIGKLVVDYIRKYKIPPTQRVLIEQHGTDDRLRDQINAIYEALPELAFETSEYQFELTKFKQRFVDAKLADLRDDLRHKESLNLQDSLYAFERTLRDIKDIQSPQKSYIQKSIKSYLPEFASDYSARKKDPNLGQGILTGYSYLDYVTNGIRLGELLIVGAETSAGKSMFLNNLAIQMWLQKNTIATDPKDFTKGCNVLYFSLEMPYEACFRRTMARLADVPMYGLRDSSLSQSEFDSVRMAGKFIAKYPFDFDIVDIPRGVTVDMIEERFLEACSIRRPDIVVVDYLGLMEDRDAEGDDWLKLGYIAGKLHEFGRSNNTRVLTAVQLNRMSSAKKSYEQHEIVGVHRFGRSSLMAHHANICIQIESRPDEHLRGDLKYHIIKNRDGEKGEHTVSKRFAHAAIYDIPYIAPGRDDFGALISGSENEDDISKSVADILGT